MRVQELPTLKRLKRIRFLPIPEDAADKVPFRWEQQLHGMLYWFRLEWNSYGHYYVLALGNGPDEIVRTKLVYGLDALAPFQYALPERLRGMMIVPFDPGLRYEEEGITLSNLGGKVKVYYGFRE